MNKWIECKVGIIFLLLSLYSSAWGGINQDDNALIISPNVSVINTNSENPKIYSSDLEVNKIPEIVDDKKFNSFLFVNFLINPKETGSIISSGRALSKKMTKELTMHTKRISDDTQLARILELGPGFGPFTKKMIEKGIKEDQLTLIENQLSCFKELKQKFKKIELHKGLVQDVLSQDEFKERKFDFIISGLPLRNIRNKEERKSLLLAIFQSLEQGGCLRQFTYGFKSSIKLEEIKEIQEKLNCKISVKHEGRVFLNFPPASVYKYVLTPNIQFGCTEKSSPKNLP